MINIYNSEIWRKPIVDGISPDEKFEVSNFGRIRSFKVSDSNPKIIGGSWINGYNAIIVRLNSGKTKTIYIHKLVAETFISHEFSSDFLLVHLDYNKANNHFSNLKWMDKSSAHNHKINDPNYNLKKIKNSKLTENQVVKIKKMLERGNTRPYRIAHQFGISLTQLLRIKEGKNWSHIE